MTLSSVFNTGSLGGSGFSTFIFIFSLEVIVLGFSVTSPSSISNAVATSLTVLVFNQDNKGESKIPSKTALMPSDSIVPREATEFVIISMALLNNVAPFTKISINGCITNEISFAAQDNPSNINLQPSHILETIEVPIEINPVKIEISILK